MTTSTARIKEDVIYVRLDAATKAAVIAAAIADERNISAWVRIAIRDRLRQAPAVSQDGDLAYLKDDPS